MKHHSSHKQQKFRDEGSLRSGTMTHLIRLKSDLHWVAITASISNERTVQYRSAERLGKDPKCMDIGHLLYKHNVGRSY